MIVNNPTKENITVMLKGVTYTVKANDSLSGVPEEQALYWRGIHNFLTLSEEVKMVETKLEEEKEDEPIKEEETVEETKEEEVVEEAKEEVTEKKITLKDKIKKGLKQVTTK